MAEFSYYEPIDIITKVVMASVNKHRVGFVLEDGREIEATFKAKDEMVVFEALRRYENARVRIIGKGSYKAGGKLQQITEIDKVELLKSDLPTTEPIGKTIAEEFDEIVSTITQDVLESLPTDGAERHDFYLYQAH